MISSLSMIAAVSGLGFSMWRFRVERQIRLTVNCKLRQDLPVDFVPYLVARAAHGMFGDEYGFRLRASTEARATVSVVDHDGNFVVESGELGVQIS
jgi:hypothetical protein